MREVVGEERKLEFEARQQVRVASPDQRVGLARVGHDAGRIEQARLEEREPRACLLPRRIGLTSHEHVECETLGLVAVDVAHQVHVALGALKSVAQVAEEEVLHHLVVENHDAATTEVVLVDLGMAAGVVAQVVDDRVVPIQARCSSVAK